MLALAAALVFASELGLHAPFRANPLACLLAAALLVVARPSWCTRGNWIAGSCLCALVLLRSQALPIPVVHGATPGSAQVAREVTSDATPLRTGRYRQSLPGLGWLEEADGRPPESLLQLEDTAISDGDWISIPSRTELVPWPRASRAGSLAARFRDGVTILQADEVVRLSESQPSDGFRVFGERAERTPSFAERFVEFRKELADRTARSLPEETAGVARALLFGDRSELDAETSDLFTRTGTRHLLAVSGMHVALAAGLLLLPLCRLVERLFARRGRHATGRRVASASFTVLMLGFAGLAGFGEPVVRAAFALVLAAVAPHVPSRRSGLASTGSGRQADALSLWALVLVVELLVDPRSTRSLAIQLSYLATLGILIGTRPLARTLQQMVARVFGSRTRQHELAHLQPTDTWWRIPLTRFTRSLLVGLAASCAAVIATLPIAWLQFGECSPIGILATALILPLFTLIMGALWTCGLLSLASLSSPLFELASDLVQLLISLLAQLDRLPLTPLPLPARPFLLIAFASTAVLLAAATRSVWWKRAAALAFGLLLVPWTAAPRGLEYELLDVGHGCALLVRAPGLPCLLFDAGSRDRRYLYREALAPLLASWEVADPVIALTHNDRDHASGLAKLVERYPPRQWLGELPEELRGRLPAACTHLDLPAGSLEYEAPRGATSISLLRGRKESGNEGSRAVELVFEDERLLLFGDSEGEGLGALLQTEALVSPVDLLLLPHHGSDSPWLNELLDQARPREIWISAASDPALARELDRRGVPWSVTSRTGPLRSRPAP